MNENAHKVPKSIQINFNIARCKFEGLHKHGEIFYEKACDF